MSFGALGALAGAQIGKQKPPGPSPAVAGAQAGASPPRPSAPPSAAAGAQAGAQVGSQQQPGNPGGIAGANLAAINAFKNSPAFKQSLVNVFAQQGPSQKQAIVNGALKNPNTPESQAVLSYVKSLASQGGAQGATAGARAAGGAASTQGTALSGQGTVDTHQGVLGDIGSFLAKGIGDYGGKPTAKNASSQGYGLIGSPGAIVPGQAQMQANPVQAAKNLGTDALNLVPNTVQGIAKIGSQIGQGDIGGALHTVVDPYVSAFSGNLGKMAYQQPLTTALMFAGPEAIGGRFAGSVARSGALGEHAAQFADRTRAPLTLGTAPGDASVQAAADAAKAGAGKAAAAPVGAVNPLVDLRSYSPNLLHSSIQKANEARLRAKGIDPNVARPAPRIMPTWLQNSLNVGLQARQRTIANEEAGWRLRAGPEFRAQAIRAAKSVQPKDPIAANAVGHILQGAIRTPETAAADAIKKADSLAANAPTGRSLARVQNQAQIRDLRAFAQAPAETHAAAFKAAASLRHEIHAKDAVMAAQGMMPADQMLRSSLMQYAQDHMGAKPGPDGMVHPNGDPLTTAQIEKHMQTHNPNMARPAYVGHYPSKGSFWNYYQRYKMARGSKGAKPKSGYAYRIGAYDHTFDGLIAQQAKTAEAITKGSLHDRIVNRASVGKPEALQKPGENGMFTAGEGRIAAHNAYFDEHGQPRPGAQEWVPMTASPVGTLKAVSEIQHPSQLVVPASHEMNPLSNPQLEAARSYELNALQHSLNDAQIRTDGARNVVLVPKTLTDQLQEQFKPAGKGATKIGHVTQQFRRTVLPYSTHWMGQIVTEAVLRSLVAGVIDPRNIAAGHQLMDEWSSGFKGVKPSTRAAADTAARNDPLGRSAARETTGATFYNRHDPLAKHNPNPGVVSDFLHRTPVTRQLIQAHNAYADGVGATMGRLEREFRIMALGKFARQQAQEFTKSYQFGVRLQGRVVAQLAERGRTDPAWVARMGRQIDDTLGKYRNLSPTVRAATQSVAPFLPWYLNAAKFVLWNLPVHHPVAQALLASIQQTINQDVADGKAQPLGPYAEQALARVLPFGILPQPAKQNFAGYGQEATRLGFGVLLPQAAGALQAMRGLDPFGAPLKGPTGQVGKKSGKPLTAAVQGGSPQSLSSAANSLMQALLPGTRQAQLALEGGAKSYNTSTLWNPQPKPGEPQGLGVAFNRIFNPLYSFNSARKGDAASTANASAKATKATNAAAKKAAAAAKKAAGGSRSSGGLPSFGGSGSGLPNFNGSPRGLPNFGQ